MLFFDNGLGLKDASLALIMPLIIIKYLPHRGQGGGCMLLSYPGILCL